MAAGLAGGLNPVSAGLPGPELELELEVQGWMLQPCVWAMLVPRLVRSCVPPPHEAEHGDHEVQPEAAGGGGGEAAGGWAQARGLQPRVCWLAHPLLPAGHRLLARSCVPPPHCALHRDQEPHCGGGAAVAVVVGGAAVGGGKVEGGGGVVRMSRWQEAGQ